ncbi:Uma2 family endonuclease [Streptomyces sp. NPDC001586]|uniref:Uma2 family endonuclease n=1 Tax=Streptomyces sp. NPDC001586 TaxID=3154387 RepID=UPI0033294E04
MTSSAEQDLDEAVWIAWQAAADSLPEGFRAEILDGRVEISARGHARPGGIANRLRARLDAALAGSGFGAVQCTYVVYGRNAWQPDVLLAPDDDAGHATDDGLEACAVELVVEVVSPGRDNISRDRIRKRRAYARAGIPVYIVIDDYDERGAVTVLTGPDPEKGVYDDEVRAAYGTAVAVPAGPAKGFVIGEGITGGLRGQG